VTEAEWLACEEPDALLAVLMRRGGNRRRFHLFACACCREAWALLHDRRSRLAVRRVEQYADADESDRLRGVCNMANAAYHEGARRDGPFSAPALAARAAMWAATSGWCAAATGVALALEAAYGVTRPTTTRREAALLRDIFGNPFRPAAFSGELRTDTAVSLARRMYEARDFSAMPILADALQDAGCADEQILDHCRGSGPHVRGCWVVDLVLGKE
jgi:hypothetical protein